MLPKTTFKEPEPQNDESYTSETFNEELIASTKTAGVPT